MPSQFTVAKLVHDVRLFICRIVGWKTVKYVLDKSF